MTLSQGSRVPSASVSRARIEASPGGGRRPIYIGPEPMADRRRHKRGAYSAGSLGGSLQRLPVPGGDRQPAFSADGFAQKWTRSAKRAIRGER